MLTGVLFADLRGFTARSAGEDPEAISQLLGRFYHCAEDVLFPDAVIDKVIGDEVMALYLPELKRDVGPADVPPLMLDHARDLLRSVGYGSADGPFVEMGIGLDIGEAFVGNIGQRALYDFTAVGDVVNTASRLQGQAGKGEIVLSDRVAAGLSTPAGERVELTLKGKDEPQVAYRVGRLSPEKRKRPSPWGALGVQGGELCVSRGTGALGRCGVGGGLPVLKLGTRVRTYVPLVCESAHIWTRGAMQAARIRVGRNRRSALLSLPMSRIRLDMLLAERGLVPSRTAAATTIRAGKVRLGSRRRAGREAGPARRR